MKRNIFAIIAAVIMTMTCVGAYAQQPDHLFPYPVVPDSKGTLSERCNFLVYKFWDQCPIKASFSSMAKLNQAFGDWIGFMPYATADTVNLAIDNYLIQVNRQAPEHMSTVGRMAESWLYSDSAEYNGEEVYLRFINAMLDAKKVSKAEKTRYAAQKQIIESSSVGRQVPPLQLTLADGTKTTLTDINAPAIIVYFNDPDCLDCTLAKARLSADMYANQLIDSGVLKIVAIYPGEATDEWRAAAAKYPENWIVAANDDIDTYFALPELPVFYVLDDNHRVIAKNLPIENILYITTALSQQPTE